MAFLAGHSSWQNPGGQVVRPAPGLFQNRDRFYLKGFRPDSLTRNVLKNGFGREIKKIPELVRD